MCVTYVTLARPRRNRPSRFVRQDGAIRQRHHAPQWRPGCARLGLSGRKHTARACHLPASSRWSPSGTELVRCEDLGSVS